MATVAEIKQQIINSIASKPELAGLSTSQVAEWVAYIDVIASSEYLMEQLWLIYSAELDAKGQQINIGTRQWFADKALEWQDGDPLVVIGGIVQYATIDATKRKVKYVAINESGDGRVIIKTAKLVGSDLAPLANDEHIRFVNYMNKRKIPGIKTAYVSQAADLVKVVIDVRYNGTLILSEVKAKVETAINNHLRNIFFDGKFNLNLFRDAIEVVDGVDAGGVTINSVQIKPSGASYVSVSLDYYSVSGYYQIDPAFPLDNVAQINYIAV